MIASTRTRRLGTGPRPLLCAAALVVLAVGGCASPRFVELRPTPSNPLAEQLSLYARGGPRPSERTEQFLRRHDLASKLLGDDEELLGALAGIHARQATAESCYALAELNYIAAKKHELTDRERAQQFHMRSLGYSYQYLFDPQYGAGRNPYDPQFRGACDLYNGALESCLRIARKDETFAPGRTVPFGGTEGAVEVSIVPRGFSWRAEDFERFEFVSDYRLTGLRNQYRTYGLGVPLVAVRRSGTQPQPIEKYYARGLSFPVTAFLRLEPDADGPGRPKVVLELYDPLEVTDVSVAGQTVPLESDISTPLAYFLDDPSLADIETKGLLRPEEAKALSGLYMVQPYQPGKIPVVMVHGLWSSPMTWMEALNDLRSRPELRENYQFWFYLYPTGEPFWRTAAELREDLAEVRRTFDPSGEERALGEMVLVGHSMGGLISRLMTLDSGDAFWNAVSDRPLQQVSASDDVRKDLERTFFFRGDRSVTRVVTIASPHRGSTFANQVTRWLGRKLIEIPRTTIRTTRQLLEMNPGVFKAGDPLVVRTSIDSLSPDSPILQVMLRVEKPGGVKYHNVVGVTEEDVPLAENTDGVVAYASAHLEDVESELVVQASHSEAHRHPRTILELQRILIEHLREARPQMGGAIIPVHAQKPAAPAATRQTVKADGWLAVPRGAGF